MDTDVLRWFADVVDGVTVTEVADLYMVSQPAVSRALARLEKEVGTPLLTRSGRVLRPTPGGVVFQRHVAGMLHSLDDGLAALSELTDPEAGRVNVAFQPSLGTWLVPDLVGRFTRQHPRVVFDLIEGQDALGSSLVSQGRVDVEFTARQPRNPEVHWERLVTQALLLAVPSDHRLAGSGPVSLADVATDPFVMMRSAWELRSQTEDLCAAAGFTPEVAFEGDDLTTLAGFVAAGLGVAVIPGASNAPVTWAGDLPVVPLTDPNASRELGISWSTQRRLLPSAALFRDFVIGHFEERSRRG